MKKIYILLILIVYCCNLACDVDYNLESEFGFGGNGFLQYSNGKYLSPNSYGYAIYEIQADGTLENISNVRHSLDFNYCYSHDKISNYGQVSDGFVLWLFDTSVPNEQTLLWEIEIENSNLFSAEMFENYILLKSGEHQYTIYDMETFQPVSQIDNIRLIYQSKVGDEGSILYDYGDSCYYYYIVDGDGVLQKKYNLGEEERKVAIDGDKMIAYTEGDIDFYHITEADSLDYLGFFCFSEALAFRSKVAYINDRIALTMQEGYPPEAKLFLYDVADVSSVYSINLIDSVELSNRPFTESSENPALVQNGTNLYLLSREYLIQASIENDVITLNDIGTSSIINLCVLGLIKDNMYYVENRQRNCSLKTYSLADLTNVQDIPHNFPDASAYRFLEENQKVVRYDELTGTIYFYDFSEDEMILEATYAPQPPFLQNFFNALKWDGSHFIYRSKGTLYSVIYRNGEFMPTWSIMSSDNYLDIFQYVYGIYENYIYEYKRGTGIIVHEFDENSINQINSLTTPFNNNEGGVLYIKDAIMTVADKIIALSYDPINLSDRYNLNQDFISASTIKHNDYLIYCGGEKTYEDGVLVGRDLGLFIYKLIDDIPARVGSIISDYRMYSVKAIPGRTDDSFSLLVFGGNHYSIYTCHTTPNGDLEITPVILQATNYPNPFNPETTISYDVSQKGSVTVDIYNLKGQKVKSLLNENKEAGKHSIIWQGDNDQGRQVSSGTYFYKIKNAGQEVVKKMLLMK